VELPNPEMNVAVTQICSALLSIVAGCIIIGVSRECDVDAVGGIFLGAGGLGLLISVYPFIRAWLNFNHILPSLGARIHVPGESSVTHSLTGPEPTLESLGAKVGKKLSSP
uniref:Kinocilin n=1 Tax=Scleropages formosus TaxID=113540 RepID=A0A8C9W281_SCLFO